MSYQIITPLAGLAGLGVAWWIRCRILRTPAGGGRMMEIAEQLQLGARVFLKAELKVLAFFVVLVGALIAIFNDPYQALAFVMGAIASSSAGMVGMRTATHANVRTTYHASQGSAASALDTAFMGGSVMGITVASVGLIGIGTLFLFFGSHPDDIHVIHGFAMGASLVALFFRVGGGIFTKAADVGADLVGKVESGIPEDDPRNPGVIADNVGDNVGDVAGMGSDIFESYCGAQIASIAIAATLAADQVTRLADARAALLYLPLALTSVGLVGSLIGILLVRGLARKSPLAALRAGMLGAMTIFFVLAFLVIWMLGVTWQVWGAALSGALAGGVIGLITEYYTAGRPVRAIARAAEFGVAPTLLAGLALGMQSVVVPLLTYATVIFVGSHLAGIYGVGIAAVGMLATVGMTMAVDAYGPIADNAGGIAEMSGMPPETRRITDSLDEVGNTTAAIGKGFAIGAAGLAALTLISAYVNTVRSHHVSGLTLDLTEPELLIGLFIGGCIPFLVASIAITAVGDAACKMIEEIRRQFRSIPGLLQGTAKPDNARCVDIATKAALKKMVLPSTIAISAPVVVGFGLGAASLGGMLSGALLSGILVALYMANSGGAWDNAKKYVEQGFHGGKGSEAHKACVVGDTVGDPLKDTAGPSMNILINVMAIVSLVIAPLLRG